MGHVTRIQDKKYQSSVGKLGRKTSLRRPRRRGKDIRIDVNVVESKSVE
jgi:hypothetical protein